MNNDLPAWTCPICHTRVSAVWYVEVDDAGRWITAPCTCVLSRADLHAIRDALIRQYPFLTVVAGRP